MIKVSFDFDSTLDRGEVQHFAKQLISNPDIDVWIVTSRVPDEKAPSDNWNNDLWFVCKSLGISKDKVVFTSYSSKHEFFWDKDFLFHLDDDQEEIRMINALSETKSIDSLDPTWAKQIEILI